MSGSEYPPIHVILEFVPILRHAAGMARSPLGRERILASAPHSDTASLQTALDRVSAMQALLGFDDPFPLSSFPNFRPALARAEIEGAFLDAPVFRALRDFLAMSRSLAKYFTDRPDKYPELQPLAKRLCPLPDLEKAIDRVVDEQGEVRDRASEALAAIRREMGRIEGRIRGRLESLLRQMVQAGYAQEDALVFRQGRSLIPMVEGHRGRLQGVVVDQSQTGGTVFMEPLEVVELRNRLERLRAEEQDEIERILRALTDQLRDVLPDVETNLETATALDVLAAKARFGLELKAVPAVIAQTGDLGLINARHPLLLLKMDYTDVVPLSVTLDDDRRTIVITGPNAGGKTVALKTVGLLALMHMHGLPVPADPKTRIPLFRLVFADIGDRQSIEQDLSTFSSHIRELRHILDHAGRQSLVLMDEIGSATDPAEGSALAQVVLSELTRRGATTLATTHMGALKVFAHETPGVENGSMVFDQATLRPTYRFQAGIPGSSYAFEIAQRLGLEPDLVQQARDLVGEDRGQVERLINHLEDELRQAEAFRRDAELKEARLAGLTALYEDRVQKLKDEGEARKQALVEEAETMLKEANAAVENMVREIREKQAEAAVVKEAKATLDHHRRKVSSARKKAPVSAPPEKLAPGDWVVWEGQGGKGQVVSAPDGQGRVQVEMNGVKLRIPMRALRRAQGPAKKAKAVVSAPSAPDDISTEIDVRGMTGLEAVDLVDKYLSDANLSGFGRVSIIHGKGTGVLRREIGILLKSHPLVKSQRHGTWQEGDTGVTIVELR